MSAARHAAAVVKCQVHSHSVASKILLRGLNVLEWRYMTGTDFAM